MKQLNIFGELDFINEEGEVKRCEICRRSIEVGDICSNECGQEWIKKYIDNAGF